MRTHLLFMCQKGSAMAFKTSFVSNWGYFRSSTKGSNTNSGNLGLILDINQSIQMCLYTQDCMNFTHNNNLDLITVNLYSTTVTV